MNPKQVKKLQARSRALRAKIVSNNVVAVTSRSRPPVQHFVTVETTDSGEIVARCTCPWGMNGGACCSHVMAALNLLAGQQKRRVSFWRSEDEAARQKHRILRVAGGTPGSAIFITTRRMRNSLSKGQTKRHEEARGAALSTIRPPSASRGLFDPSSGARYSTRVFAPAD